MSENQRPFTSAILVAAGGSTRMGVPKQTIPLCGIPVIVRTLLAFEAAQRVDEILLVTREEDVEAFARLCQDYGAAKVRRVLPAGKPASSRWPAGWPPPMPAPRIWPFMTGRAPSCARRSSTA